MLTEKQIKMVTEFACERLEELHRDMESRVAEWRLDELEATSLAYLTRHLQNEVREYFCVSEPMNR
jgi:hypothetical protein